MVNTVLSSRFAYLYLSVVHEGKQGVNEYMHIRDFHVESSKQSHALRRSLT